MPVPIIYRTESVVGSYFFQSEQMLQQPAQKNKIKHVVQKTMF